MKKQLVILIKRERGRETERERQKAWRSLDGVCAVRVGWGFCWVRTSSDSEPVEKTCRTTEQTQNPTDGQLVKPAKFGSI